MLMWHWLAAKRSYLIADRRLLLYFRLGVLAALVQRIGALRCFAGDPAYQHECTSLSYCLLIVSRTGRSQWSCDGNSFNQVSLCSNLGLMEDLAAGGDDGERASAVAVFESAGGGRGGGDAASLSRHGDSAGIDEDALAEYYRQQEATVRHSLSLGDEDGALSSPRKRVYFAGGGKQEDQYRRRGVPPQLQNLLPFLPSTGKAPPSRTARRIGGRNAPASIRYYSGQSRCFDGGDLGRICCCSSDFCNGATIGVLPRLSLWSVGGMRMLAAALLIVLLPFLRHP